MRLLDLDYSEMHKIVQLLEVEDYSAGPLVDDKGRPRDLWVFGTYIKEYETYIKFAVYIVREAVKSICVSFHEVERPLPYPYRKAS